MNTIQTIYNVIKYVIQNPNKSFDDIIGNIDSMTGLYNRNKLEIDKSSFKEGNYLCITDCNGLKIVNDTLGHAQGDILIKFWEIKRFLI